MTRSAIAGFQPDFIIVGAMKSGTTTLYRWLADQPGVHRSTVKEPNFLSRDEAWARGIAWYGSLFADRAHGSLLGEASVSYMDPFWSPAAAARYADLGWDASLICILRDPFSRMRAHYVHNVLRGRERRPLDEAVSDPRMMYLRRSLYYEGLRPWLQLESARLLVVHMDDLFGPDESGWGAVLRHVGLPYAPRPLDAHNTSDRRVPLSARHARLASVAASVLPRRVRTLAKQVLIRRALTYRRDLVDQAADPLPAAVVGAISRDQARLRAALPHAVARRQGRE